MCHRVTRQLDSHPGSVTAGRHFAADALASWGLTSAAAEGRARENILLVATELLSNAVKAASGPVTLAVEGHRQRVDIGVVDDSPDLPVLRPTGMDTPGGRGLRIVDALSERWGHRLLDDRSKEVWAHLAIPAHAPLAVNCMLAVT